MPSFWDMFGSAPPPTPDYTGAANAQAGASQENTTQQMYANRPNQYSPFGSTTWTPTQIQDPSTGQYYTTFDQNTQLAEPLANAANNQMATQESLTGFQNQLVNNFGPQMTQMPNWGAAPAAGQGISQYTGGLVNSLDFSGAPALAGSVQSQGVQRSLGDAGQIQTGIQDSAGDYQTKAQDALYGQMTSRLDPQWNQRQEQMQSQLLNQGLRPGDAAYDQQMQQFNLGRNDAYSSALNNAIGMSGSEASRMFGIDLSRGQFGNQAQNQQFGQNLAGGQFYNQAGQQAFNQDLAGGQFDLARRGMATSEIGQQGAFQNQAAGQNFSQQQAASAYDNQLRQQFMNEQMQQQGWGLNAINAALAGGQVGMPQMPNFQGAGTAQTPQYLQAAGMQYGAGLDQYNAQQAQQQGLMNGAMQFAPFMF